MRCGHLLVALLYLRLQGASAGFPKLNLKDLGKVAHDAGKAIHDSHVDKVVADAVKNPGKAVEAVSGGPPEIKGVAEALAGTGTQVAKATQGDASQLLEGTDKLQGLLEDPSMQQIGKALEKTVPKVEELAEHTDPKKVERIVKKVESADPHKVESMIDAVDTLSWWSDHWKRPLFVLCAVVLLLVVCSAVLGHCCGRGRRNREAVSTMIDAEINMYLNPGAPQHGSSGNEGVFTRF